MESPALPRSVAKMAAFDSPRAEQPVRLAVIADPHVCIDEMESDKVYKSASILERTIQDINLRDVDYTISVGDLTLEGRSEEYGLFDETLQALDSPFAAIPGNHDVRKSFNSHPGISTEDFTDRYTPGRVPFHLQIGDVDVIGLDSASAETVADSHDGYVDSSQIAWLDDTLRDADNAIVFVHHNLPGAIDQFDEYRESIDPSLGTPPVLREPDPLVDVLLTHDVSLVLSGHLHIPAFATTDTVREVIAPSTCTFPQSYLIVEVDSTGTTIQYIPVTTIQESTIAFTRRSRLKPKAKALTTMAAVRLGSFPLFRAAESTSHRTR